MVSWAELYARGARSGHEGGKLFLECPPALDEELRAEIYRRAPAMAAPRRIPGIYSGACDACGEPLPAHRGGWCPLCTAARDVALRGRRAA